jgi:hypothetical protein
MKVFGDWGVFLKTPQKHPKKTPQKRNEIKIWC